MTLGVRRRRFPWLVLAALCGAPALAATHDASVRAAPAANGEIVFTSDRTGARHLFVMRSDGRGQTQITAGAGDDVDPAWSPDGRRIAFASNRGGDWDIYVIDADGGGLRRVTSDPATDRYPAFSPDGQTIAFRSNRVGSEIWLAHSDGSETRLTHGAYADQPSWSPDGRKLAYVGRVPRPDGTAGDDEIFAINADGTGAENLTNDPGASDRYPGWSPDGRTIVLRRLEPDGGGRELYTIGVGADRALRPIDALNPGRAPSWSPDGGAVTFVSGRSGNQEIYVGPVDGSAPASRLTLEPSTDDQPRWANVSEEQLGRLPSSGPAGAASPVLTTEQLENMAAIGLRLRVPHRLHIGRSHRIRIVARCRIACHLVVRGRGRVRDPREARTERVGRRASTFFLRARGRRLRAGARSTMHLKLRRPVVKKALGALLTRKRVVVAVDAVASDAAGRFTPHIVRRVVVKR